MEFYVAGRIATTHALKGEVKIKNLSSFERFNEGANVYIKNVKFTIKTHRIVKQMDYVVFEGYEDINLILPFVGEDVLVCSDQLEKLVEDEFYYHELVGKEVINKNNKHIGIVVSVREMPQGELLEVDTGKKKNALIPFRREFVLEVKEKIVIEEMEGLI